MQRATPRRSFELALAALLLGSGLAHAAVLLDDGNQDERSIGAGQAADVTVTVPFHLDAPGRFYAKLLATPWNAVDDGAPNGTVAPDHSAGLRGWYVSFFLADGSGAPLTKDADGATVQPDLGTYSDSTPTPLVALAADTPYQLLARIHVPAEGAVAGSENRVAFALVFRDAAPAGGNGASGATLDPSRAFTQTIRVTGTASPSPAGGPAAPSPAPATGPGSAAGAAPQAGTLLLAAAAAAGALLVLLLVAVLLLLREVRRLRRAVERLAPPPRPLADAEPTDDEAASA